MGDYSLMNSGYSGSSINYHQSVDSWALKTDDGQGPFEGHRPFYPANRFGYIPKSDTYKHLTVSEEFNDQKQKHYFFHCGNRQHVAPDYTLSISVPPRSVIVKFALYIHDNAGMGVHQMILPRALPGLKIKIIFCATNLNLENLTASPPVLGWPSKEDEYAMQGDNPETQTLNLAHDGPYQNTEQLRAKLAPQTIRVRSRPNDILRGVAFKPGDEFFSVQEPTGSEVPHGISFLPFTAGAPMDIQITESVRLENVLASHADFECFIPGQWHANFVGLWSGNFQ